MIGTWQAPLPNGKVSEELLLALDQGRSKRVLILPAWFDEANKLRRFAVQTMRALDEAGFDSFLPDLPGCNESLTPLDEQSIASWKDAALHAAQVFDATHILAIRAGALIAPSHLPGWQYAPQNGPKLLRGMLRARVIASREAGRDENSEALLEQGKETGLTLAGWRIGREMLCELETATPTTSEYQIAIAQKQLGGPGLWLRAEPDEDQAQVEALARVIAADKGEQE